MKLQVNIGYNKTKEVNLREREVTLMLGENIGKNIGDSIGHACQLLESGKAGNVLYINKVIPVNSCRHYCFIHYFIPVQL